MAALPEDVVGWAVETGLGPLLARAVAHDPDAATSPLWPLVQGADLTARFLAAQQLGAMTDIVDACRGEVPAPVLLKGISVCDQYYPECHLRPMRDLDFLVEEEAIPGAESILRSLGYRQWSRHPAAFYEGHHHSCPFVHPETGVWVEVHRALFAPGGKLGSNTAFGPEHLKTQFRWSEFRGRRVRRLSDELQIVHLACHWACGLRAVGGMVAMADMAYLLKDDPTIDWQRIHEWTDTTPASRHLCLLLTYLHKHRLIDIAPEILHRLHRMQTSPDRITLRIAHSLLDRYVVHAHDFGVLMSERNFNRLWTLLVLRRGTSRDRGQHEPLAASNQLGDDPGQPGTAGDEVETRASEIAIRRGVMTMKRSGAEAASVGTSAPLGAEHGRTGGASTSLYPKRRSGVRVRPVAGEMLILDRQRQLVHQVNQTARFIWDRCDGEHTIVHIASELAQSFDVDPQTAARDVTTALQRLQTVGLVDMRTGWRPREAQARRT